MWLPPAYLNTTSVQHTLRTRCMDSLSLCWTLLLYAWICGQLDCWSMIVTRALVSWSLLRNIKTLMDSPMSRGIRCPWIKGCNQLALDACWSHILNPAPPKFLYGMLIHNRYQDYIVLCQVWDMIAGQGCTCWSMFWRIIMLYWGSLRIWRYNC
jgi:hypothetical protein